MSKSLEQAAVTEQNPHWNTPKSQPWSMLWSLLCLVSVSRPNLEDYWKSTQADDLWEKQAKKSVERMTNSVTVVCFWDMFGGRIMD